MDKTGTLMVFSAISSGFGQKNRVQYQSFQLHPSIIFGQHKQLFNPDFVLGFPEFMGRVAIPRKSVFLETEAS
ncbi:hypothetical protein Q4534_02925 [Cyclobacterium sp. 1_MG-2023]|uniref:hypothetical protein n=1 Tax=Cyclobacterium sp. 1_MG-2023 TaxID=3062681 RepID=UPI0026E240B6|nr:hypothetical protein [Cyclobacterium sp. 1_MG-2023]MDO6436340.1 hypothetical protein [Cyclobacterium sp. 1_MG-2023]